MELVERHKAKDILKQLATHSLNFIDMSHDMTLTDNVHIEQLKVKDIKIHKA